jgi:hypothetical protein
MTTIVQFLPQWLRSRFRKPRKVSTLCKKRRQVLPTLPHRKRSTAVGQEDRLEIESHDGDGNSSSTEFIMSKGEDCDCIERDNDDQADERVSPEHASEATLPNDTRPESPTSKFLAALYYWVISRR